MSMKTKALLKIILVSFLWQCEILKGMSSDDLPVIVSLVTVFRIHVGSNTQKYCTLFHFDAAFTFQSLTQLFRRKMY